MTASLPVLLRHAAERHHAAMHDCPECEGRQAIQTGVDYFGQPLLRTCVLCQGTGEVDAATLRWWQEARP